MSHLLAIDPGSTMSGWVLTRRETARVRYLTSGTCGSTPKGVVGLVEQMAKLLPRSEHEALVIAIEAPEGMIFQPFRAPDLLETREAVGVFATVAWIRGIPIVRMTANAVRKTLVGKATSPKKGLMDKLVGDAVRANVIAWPAESNVHARDAAALAVVANWQLLSKRVA